MESPHDNALAGSLVSVILPVHNRADWVTRAIKSVLSQSYPHFELLVINDGSTDGTRHVLKGFTPRITILDQPHSGAEAARNLGLEHARGEFVAFIDSDDVWYADRLSRQLPLFSRDEVGLVFGNATLVDYRQGTPRRLRRTFFDGVRPSRGRVLEAFAAGCFVPCSSVVARRQCFEVAGGFTPGHVAADYLKWLEISASYELDYVPEPVFEYAIHAGGLSHSLPETLADRLAAFRELQERNLNPEMDLVIRRILFNLSVSLRIAHLRQGSKSRPVRPPFIPPASPSERLNWALKFAANQISTRGRWWIMKSANALSDSL
ncbi:MAG TPA: glycosyltransferase family 2 protein [Pyrinomonadaceae bacterium]|nr:glycosyltransferase family 2 protein [Pyrinomonadaceae bacterium]